MKKEEKVAVATHFSERFKQSHPGYSSVDGRTYVLDRPVPSPKAQIKTAAIRNSRDRPSMIDIYRIEYWLMGKGRYTKSSVPTPERDRIISEYALEFVNRLQRYSSAEEAVWSRLLEKFGEKIANEKIKDYTELLYRAKHRR